MALQIYGILNMDFEHMALQIYGILNMDFEHMALQIYGVPNMDFENMAFQIDGLHRQRMFKDLIQSNSGSKFPLLLHSSVEFST
jgi:hypothetical protein